MIKTSRKQVRIGPEDDGRRMSLDDFDEAIAAEGEYWEFGVDEYWIIDASKNQMTAMSRWRGQWKKDVIKPTKKYSTHHLPGFSLGSEEGARGREVITIHPEVLRGNCAFSVPFPVTFVAVTNGPENPLT